MRRPFGDGGAIFAQSAGVVVYAPAPPMPLTVPSDFGMLRLVSGEERPYLAKVIRLRALGERRT